MRKWEKDYLTGLANRRGLYDYYDSLPENSTIHAMFIDIDNFKRVNDIYGHSMGDKLLIQISNLIKSHANGFTSRIGGDEYVVIMDGSIPSEETERIAQTLINDMENIDFRSDILSLVSLSIGIVLDQSLTQLLDDILSKCDAAMYQAKYDGKNRYTVYHSTDKTFEINRNIEAEMDSALENGEFKVFLQPKVNMVSSGLYGAEALSRWDHPVDGIRSPDSYIPLFEKNGFISKLDMYVFEEVCKLKQHWKETNRTFANVPISVNMSRLHLYNKMFPTTLDQIAHKYNVPKNELELEITESTFIKDNEEMIRVIDSLQSRGFMVSIDDFGSGYSALNLLKDLMVDIVKIDKEFLRISSNTQRGRKVIRNVIALCRDLKIDVITEGIETKEQVDFITRCGCQIAQGFYYSKPLPVNEYEKFADEYMTNVLSKYRFTFNGTMLSEDKSLEASFPDKHLEFVKGIFKDSKALHFPGGPTGTNIVQLPPESIVNDSYTVSMWIKPEAAHFWASALYIKFETGFSSIIPVAWEGHSSFRIRDSKEVNGWYDASGLQLETGNWWHYVATYNAKTETSIAFLNGKVVSVLREVPTNRYVKLIILGGDVFQPSFIGDICEVVIYNEAKDFDFAKNLYDHYLSNENFDAGPLRDV